MLRSQIRKLTGADSAIDAIVERGPNGLSSDDHDRVYQAGSDLISPHMHSTTMNPVPRHRQKRDTKSHVEFNRLKLNAGKPGVAPEPSTPHSFC